MNETRQANNFDLEGGGLEIGYTLPRGELSLRTVDFGDRTLEVEPYPIAIGMLAHLTLESTADGNEISLTILLPDVNLTAGVDEVAVSAQAIITTHRSSIGGPGLVDGQIQSYDVRPLSGTAYFAGESASL